MMVRAPEPPRSAARRVTGLLAVASSALVVLLELAVTGGLQAGELALHDGLGFLVLAVHDRDLRVARELERLAQRRTELGHEGGALLLVHTCGRVGRLRLGRDHGLLELHELLQRRRARLGRDALAERLERAVHL